MSKTRVLFMCVGNTARSQMAEAFLRADGGDRFEAFSAGFEPQEIDPMTIAVMEERGFDMGGARAKGLHEFLGKAHFGYLIIVCDRDERGCPKTFPSMGTRLMWPFEDPVAVAGTEQERLAKFPRGPRCHRDAHPRMAQGAFAAGAACLTDVGPHRGGEAVVPPTEFESVLPA